MHADIYTKNSSKPCDSFTITSVVSEVHCEELMVKCDNEAINIFLACFNLNEQPFSFS